MKLIHHAKVNQEPIIVDDLSSRSHVNVSLLLVSPNPAELDSRLIKARLDVDTLAVTHGQINEGGPEVAIEVADNQASIYVANPEGYEDWAVVGLVK